MSVEEASQIAPGSRVLIREEEWLVRKIDRSSAGNKRLSVVGLSNLVRNREAVFLEDLEPDLEVVDPAQTAPSLDASPSYRDSRLHLEFLLRQTTPSDARLRLGHQGAMDVLPYQLDPAHLALQQPRQRILIADAVGLGKTIEAGVLLSELMRRGKGRRVLVLTVKSMLTQFQKELWARFSIPLVRLDSAALQRIRTKIPSNHNPFHYFDKTIVSIDTVKQDGEYRNFLESGYWDVIVIDEAHNVAKRGGGQGAMRHRVAQLLSNRSDSLILLSATPHDGSKESFASIMNMLNPTAIKNESDYGPEDIEGLFIRRFKKDIQEQVKGAFPQRVTSVHRIDATNEEEVAFEALANLQFSAIDQNRGGHLLFRTLLEKAVFSSPAACIDTVQQRLKKIEKETDPARFKSDTATLHLLLEALKKIDSKLFSKYQLLVSLLAGRGESSIGWNPKKAANDRIVVFTERIATLDWLHSHLPSDLGLASNQVAILHGGLSDIEQNEIVEDFGNEGSPIRLLIASDVASEGINLHYSSHRLIHFDIPWSLLTFQQRNGRVDRYGQEEQPEIYYLLTESDHDKIRGDQRILEILIRKDDQVQKNIGDPSEFTGFHNVEDEVLEVGKAIEESAPAETFDASFGALEKTETDDPFLATLFGNMPTATTVEPSVSAMTSEVDTLFPDAYDWAKAAIEFIRERLKQKIQVDFLDDKREIHLHLPPDLKRRLKRLPREIRPTDDLWILTSDRKKVMKEITACRAEEGRWPTVQLLWELHPVMTWLGDKILAAFGRSDAPVIRTPNLAAGETIVLAYGLIPNRKGHPLVQRWIGARFRKGEYQESLDLPSVLKETAFGQTQIPNPGEVSDMKSLQMLIPPTVAVVREELTTAREQFDAEAQPELEKQLERLRKFRDAKYEQLELDLSLAQVRAARKRSVTDLYESYRTWIQDTMKTEDNPSIRIAAIFTSSEK